LFRVKESDDVGKLSLAEWIVRSALLIALLANIAAAYLIWREYHRQYAALPGHEDLSVQFVLCVVVSASLILCVAAIWWRRRRYQLDQTLMRRLKMLAHDILASMDYGVITTNHDAIITSINSAAIRLLGVDFECVGCPLASICVPGVSLEQIHQDVVGEGSAVRDRDCCIDHAGRQIKIRLDGYALKDTRGELLGCVIHLRDVTESVLLEERMHRMERFLGLANLASGLHHEIKNPLTALSIHIQLLEECLADGKPADAIDEFVAVLKTEVCRLNGVLESFRSFANMQKLTIQPTDGLGVVEKVIRLIRPQAAEQQVQITLLHPERELPQVPLDAEKFEQVVLNLVINALDAMPAGGHLSIQAAVADNSFQVTVQDSGPGIPAEIQRSVFQPYFSTKCNGSGMGLALSEKLISQHGGHIDYRTGPDGTMFQVTVPLEHRNENA
jgi:nitrogen-specific signal transduction histidine kinase